MLLGSIALSPLILLFLGLYYAAVGVGGLAAPEKWQILVREMDRSPIEQLLGGAIAFVVGVLLLLVGLAAQDRLAIIIRFFGALAIVKGLAILALPGRFLAFTDSLLIHRGRIFAIAALLVGIVLIILGATHLF